MCDTHRLVRVLLAALLLLARDAAAVDCSTPLAFEPIPDLHVHVGFPVDYTARLNRYCFTWYFQKVAGPPEFDLDGAGGLFYWTPARTGVETITIKATEGSQTASATFRAYVDDNTMVYPLFRDYLSQPATVPIIGRAHGNGFISYTLEYAEQATPQDRHPIAGPVTTPVDTTAPLADWDIGALPDGGRYLLTLTLSLQTGPSVLTNAVIVDRTAKPGWPKRVGPITHSVVLADLDDDGVDEVLAVTHFGELYVWRIDGTELWEVGAFGTTQTVATLAP